MSIRNEYNRGRAAIALLRDLAHALDEPDNEDCLRNVVALQDQIDTLLAEDDASRAEAPASNAIHCPNCGSTNLQRHPEEFSLIAGRIPGFDHCLSCGRDMELN